MFELEFRPETPERLGDLTPQARRALLAQLLQQKEHKPQVAPLSFTQERIWFFNQLEPGSAAFNMTAAARLTGRLDVAALGQSLDEIVRRHEILRTTFAVQDGRPVQVIGPAVGVALHRIDLRHWPQAERQAQAKKLIADENRRPFDLSRDPLLRISLLELDKQAHIILFNVHHIVSDGWSQAVLLHELTTLYEAFVSGRPSPLAELPLQYADFARWQRQALQADVLGGELAYWKKQLAGSLPALELITDDPHAATAQAARRTQTLAPSLAEALKVLSLQQGVTLFMTLLAAFKALLYRYTGQTDIVIGSPIASRDRAKIEGLIGPFINTLVLRTDLSGNPTFLELLDRVRQVVLEAFEHSRLAFEQLVNALQPTRDLNRNPLFQVVFILQDLPALTLELPQLRLDPFPIDFQTVEAPDLLGVSMQDTEQGLVVVLEHRADLLNQQTLAHLETLLQSIVTDPHRCLSDLPILTQAKRQQLLEAWNDTQAHYPQDVCFSQLFEEQVTRAPNTVAAVCGAAHLTYWHLNQRANCLARFLIEQDVGPEVVVALLAERGLDFLTAILAVFKAGGAYLPLDPRYPMERLRQVLRQSQSSLVLVDDAFVPVLSDALDDIPVEARPLVLRLSHTLGQERAINNLPARATPRNLAYVIYTSGSTGVPKGAMLEQRGMVNHQYAKIRDLALSQDDVVAQNASQSFDISVWQFLAPLLVGARVEIFTDKIAHDSVRLLKQVARRRVTILEIVPSLLRVLLEQIIDADLDPSALAALRWLMPTGEALPPDLARDWLRRYPSCPLVNAYGPSECSDDVTHGFLTRPPSAKTIRTPIGRPIANLQIYVLDARLQPVPVGVAGELCVGGVGVGRGYLHEPKKTAQAFIPNPFPPFSPPRILRRGSHRPASGATPRGQAQGGQRGGTRLYKTGDLACYRPDGVLEFLGRIDHQVKIRGFRIELEEIEALLRQHPAIREAVVVDRAAAHTPGDKQLVAYAVPADEGPVTKDKERDSSFVGELRAFLGQRLPDYMVPPAFMLLDALPLTPNGKMDRRALPAPDLSQVRRTEAYVPPEDPLEERLAEIWSEMLGITEIGVYDSFFDLGGHSLLATQIVHRINRAFKIKLALRRIFEEPTIAGLALLIEETLLDELERLEA